MQFVKVNDDVVSVELSIGAVYRIANAFDTHIDVSNIKRNGEGLTDQDKALGEGFKNAFLAFKEDDTVPADSGE